jgi:O-antigen/teichoic acid export membrane protein
MGRKDRDAAPAALHAGVSSPRGATPYAEEGIPAKKSGPDSIARNSAYSFATQLTTATLTALLTIVLVRVLGPSEYGLFALALSVSSIALVAADWGVSFSTARFIAERRDHLDDAGRLFVDGFKLKVLVAATACLLLAALAEPIAHAYGQPGLAWPLRGIAVATFGQSLMLMLMGTAIALGRVVANLRMVAIESVLEVSASLVLVVLGAGATGAAFGRAFGYIVGAAIGLAFALRLVGRPAVNARRPPSREAVRSVGSYASSLMVVDAAFTMSRNANVLLVGAFLGNAASGIFQAPNRLLVLLQYPGLAVANGVAPRLARRPGHEPDVRAFRAGLRRLIAFQCVAIAPAVVWATPVVELVLGNQYLESADVLIALAPYIFLTGLGPLISNGVSYLGEARKRMPISVATLVITLVTLVTLIPAFGLVGAAVSIDVSYGFYCAGHLWLCNRLLGLSLRPLALSLARALTAAAAMGAVLFAVGTQDLGPASWILGGGAALATYVGVLVLSGEVTPRELMRLAGLLRSVGGAVPLQRVRRRGRGALSSDVSPSNPNGSSPF